MLNDTGDTIPPWRMPAGKNEKRLVFRFSFYTENGTSNYSISHLSLYAEWEKRHETSFSVFRDTG